MHQAEVRMRLKGFQNSRLPALVVEVVVEVAVEVAVEVVVEVVVELATLTALPYEL